MSNKINNYWFCCNLTKGGEILMKNKKNINELSYEAKKVYDKSQFSKKDCIVYYYIKMQLSVASNNFTRVLVLGTFY